MEKDITEDEFIAQYDLKKYPSVAVTVDICIFTIIDNKLSLLLVKRGGHPEKGKWALPGGFININESLDKAAQRELFEETGLTVDDGYLEQLKTYGNPDRDRRGYVTSVAYVALIPHIDAPIAGDDATQAEFFPIDKILSNTMDIAFDHKTIITDGLSRVRSKIEYFPIAHKFLDNEKFTLSELRNVYEIVWGKPLIPSNFRRKILSVPNLLITVGDKRTSDISGGRTSELFTAGQATEIFPPLRQPE